MEVDSNHRSEDQLCHQVNKWGQFYYRGRNHSGLGKEREGDGKQKQQTATLCWVLGPQHLIHLRTLILPLEGSRLAPVLLKNLYTQGGPVLVCTQTLRPMSFLDGVGGKEGGSELIWLYINYPLFVDEFEVYEEAIGTNTSGRPPRGCSGPPRAF